MTLNEQIEQFLSGSPFAVVGASTRRHKYGNKVLRCYQQNDLAVYPVNPHADEVEGLPCYPSLSAIPGQVHAVSIITPPDVTETVVAQAVEAGIQHLWMQPGAESQHSIEAAVAAGINVIAGGPCLLVVLGYRESV